MRKLLALVLPVVFASSFVACSSKDASEDPEFEADYVENFEQDLEEDQAEEAEQAELDTLDDLDDVEVLDDEAPLDDPAVTTASLHGKRTPPKHASHGALSIIEDDPNFSGMSWNADGSKSYDAAKAGERLDQAKALGADVVRIMLWWSGTAPGDPHSKTKPAGFVSSKPDGYDWRYLDTQVTEARRRGFKVLITITAGNMPWWASEEPDHCEKQDSWSCSWKPNVKEYAKWVTAVGRHVKEKHYRIWGFTFVNEPNIGAFLSDATSKQTAHRYRSLWFAARKAMRKTAHVKARVFFSDQANNTKSREPDAVRWDLFDNALCLKLDKNPEVIDGFCPVKHRKVHAQGVAFHPYASTPTLAKESVAFLQQLVDDAADAGAIDKNRGLYMTESAFLTARGNDAAGLGGGLAVTPEQQAVFMNVTDRLLYAMPRVKAVAQYELVDEGRGTWDSGLRFARVNAVKTTGEVVTGDNTAFVVGDHVDVRKDDGTVVRLAWADLAKNGDTAQVWAIDQGNEKPAYAAYRVSLDVVHDGSNVQIFGLARADTGAGFTVEGLFSTGWREIQTVKTDELGYGTATIAVNGATAWRLRFGFDTSREVK